jgi:hypothetical protein
MKNKDVFVAILSITVLTLISIWEFSGDFEVQTIISFFD